MRRFVQERSLGERIRFHGFQENVWDWVTGADVIVVPSLVVEAFGNTAVEAVLGARPVIVADHTGLLEAVEGLDSALRVTTEGASAPAAWADAIARVRDDWPRMRVLAMADAARARERHDPRLYGQRVARAVLQTNEQEG